jgi:hypothetical protein
VKKVSKNLATVTASIGLTLGLLSVPAQAAPVTTPTNGQVERSVTNHSFTLLAGEALEVQAYLQAPATGANGSLTASSNLEVTPQSGVTLGQKMFRWTVSGCSSQGFVMTQTIAPCPSASSLDSGIIQTVTNTTGQSVTVQVNTGTASITFNGSALPTQNRYTLAFKNVTSQNSTNGVVALTNDVSVRVSFSVCIEASVQAGDTLVWSNTSTKDGSSSAHDWSFQNGSPLANITVASTPVLRYDNVSAQATNFSPGTYQYSLDLLKNNVSVLIACPVGGGGRPTPLFPLGGATVSGKLTVGSVITASPNQWSRTDGGPAETVTNSYDWLVCEVPQATSTTRPEDVPCIATENVWILADGNSIGSDYDARLNSSTLTVSQTLLNLLAGKYLMVVLGGVATGPSASSYLFMQTCGPIASGLTCSSTFGTPSGGGTTAAPLLAQKLVKALPKKAKAGKSITIAAVTKAKVAAKVTVKGKGCKVTAVKDKKNKKKIASYKVTMGKKGVTCTVTVTAPKTSKWAALKSVTKIKAT